MTFLAPIHLWWQLAAAVLLVAYALVVVAFYAAGDRDGHDEAPSPNAAGALVSG